jgi:phosphoribosyl 1,2-cyclic phosphate phosphodiesterase
LKVYFLGTGTSQGIPVIGSNHPVCLSADPKDKRLRVSVWIHWESYSYVVDCGPDFRQQMLVSNCPKLDGIVYTHEHSDHTAGLDDIRPFSFKTNGVSIYAHPRVLDNLAKRFDYIFATDDKYPGAPSVIPHPIHPNTAFMLGNKQVIPINAYHAGLQVYGFRIDHFAYLTDVKTIDQQEIEKLRGLQVLVVNCLREESHHSHFNLSEALQFIAIVQPEKTYFTHISHTFGFHEAIQQKLPKNVYVAYDNLEITI